MNETGQALALPNLMDDMLVGISIGRQPHVSTDNKQFQAVVGKEARNIGQYDQQAGAMFLEFILVGLAKHPLRLHFPLAPKDPNDPNPAQVSTYDPKNKQPPVCSSENGIGPSADSRQPQSAFCSNCWARQWGSALSQRGERIPACTEKKRLAIIVPMFGWDTPLQFDLPPASFQNWASLTQMLRDGRITRPETVMIRAYFIPNEEGFLKFVLSPLGYNEQVFGPNAMPTIHRHMLADETKVLLGANDRPIDPATWSPQLAHAPVPGQYGQPAQIAAPREMTGAAYVAAAAQQQPAGGQPGVTYAAQPVQNHATPPAHNPHTHAAPQQHQAPASYPAQQGGYAGAPGGGSNAAQPYQQTAVAGPGGYANAPATQGPAPQNYGAGGGGGGGGGVVYQQPQNYGAGGGGGGGGVPYQPQPNPAHVGAPANYGVQPSGPGAVAGYATVQNGPGQPQQIAYQPVEAEIIPPEQNMHGGAPIDGEPAKAKRTRRTKAEMEAARVGQPQTQPQADPAANYGMAPGSQVTDALRGQLGAAMGAVIPNG